MDCQFTCRDFLGVRFCTPGMAVLFFGSECKVLDRWKGAFLSVQNLLQLRSGKTMIRSQTVLIASRVFFLAS